MQKRETYLAKVRSSGDSIKIANEVIKSLQLKPKDIVKVIIEKRVEEASA